MRELRECRDVLTRELQIRDALLTCVVSRLLFYVSSIDITPEEITQQNIVVKPAVMENGNLKLNLVEKRKCDEPTAPTTGTFIVPDTGKAIVVEQR